jgi:hypothetical protein
MEREISSARTGIDLFSPTDLPPREIPKHHPAIRLIRCQQRAVRAEAVPNHQAPLGRERECVVGPVCRAQHHAAAGHRDRRSAPRGIESHPAVGSGGGGLQHRLAKVPERQGGDGFVAELGGRPDLGRPSDRGQRPSPRAGGFGEPLGPRLVYRGQPHLFLPLGQGLLSRTPR